MPEPKLIKKYPNRRLYDTAQSAYLTLEQIRAMVLDGVPFKVVEQKTGDDITRNILMQIIVEQETDGAPMFTVDMLNTFIRAYGTETQQQFTDFVAQSMDVFARQQSIFVSQMGHALKGAPMETWAEFGKSQMQAWRKINKTMFGAADKKTDKPG